MNQTTNGMSIVIQEAQVTSSLEIVSRGENEKEVRIRAVLSGESLPAVAKPAEEPNLEEAYVAFMASQGRTKDAAQEEITP